MRVYKKYLVKVLDDSQEALSELFDDLLHIKNFHRPDFDGRKTIFFQYRLGIVLQKLVIVRNEINENEKTTVRKKVNYSPSWFRSRMKRLSDYKKAITRCIGIGKALGDIFAWHFYKTNETQLFRHLDHVEIKFPPTGIGGTGELIFIRDRPYFGGYFCILHSNTSILRFGDISLIDMKTHKLYAIGELKTEKVSEKDLIVSLTILGEDGKEIFREEFKNDPKVTTAPVNNKLIDPNRYERQIKQIREYLIAANKPMSGPDQLVVDTYHIQEFESIVAKRQKKPLKFVKVDDGLLYLAAQITPRKFSKRLYNSEKKHDFSKSEPELSNSVASLYSDQIQNFELEFGHIVYDKEFNYTAALGTAPLFWYPIKASILKKIYLQGVLVFTLFNPAYLFHQLKDIGLDFQKDETGKIKYYGMKIGEKDMGIYQMSFFLDLVKNHLHTQQCIVSAISKIVQIAKDHAHVDKPWQMEIATLQIFNDYNFDLPTNNNNQHQLS